MGEATDAGDTTPACPECDSPNVVKRKSRWGGGEAGATHYCRVCATPIEEVVWRPRKRDWTTRSGLAKRLAEADPDDVGGGL